VAISSLRQGYGLAGSPNEITAEREITTPGYAVARDDVM